MTRKIPVYYCSCCCKEYNLPYNVFKLKTIAGYCRICGFSDMFVGSISEKQAIKRNIDIYIKFDKE